MLWWIVGGIVALPLLVLGVVLAALRNRMVELDRVAALARERAEKSQRRQQARLAGLQETLAGLDQRTALMQQRVTRLKGPGHHGGGE